MWTGYIIGDLGIPFKADGIRPYGGDDIRTYGCDDICIHEAWESLILISIFTKFFCSFSRIFKGVFTPYHFQYAYFYTGEGGK